MGRRISRRKEIRPAFFVFCEGETEFEYVKYLRGKYRLPLEIIPKIAESSLTKNNIKKYKDGKEHPKDKTFLLYDLDVSGTLKHLLSLKNTILLGSNPCIELWFLIHFQENNSYISASDCQRKLVVHEPNYKKGNIPQKLKDKFKEKQIKAVNRAKKHIKFSNPSSNIFEFIEILESEKK